MVKIKKGSLKEGECCLCGGKAEGFGHMCKWCRKESELKGAGSD